MPKHEILGGKVNLYKRERSRYWQCSSFINGRNHRTSTKEESLAKAKEVAEDWFLELRGKARAGELQTGKTFAQAAEKFETEYEAITHGRRSPKWVQGHKDRIRLHLMPYFGKLSLSQIGSGTAQEYRVHRMTKPEAIVQAEESGEWEGRPWKPPARNTYVLHEEVRPPADCARGSA